MRAMSDVPADARGSAIVLTAEELSALFGAGPVGMALYVLLRAQMDFGTGLVGSACPVSLHGLAVGLERHVPRGKGFQRVLPTEKEVRMGLDALKRSGLIERVGNDELLVFRMVLAKVGNVRKFQTGHSAGTNAIRERRAVAGFEVIPGGNDPSNRAHVRDQGIADVNTTAACPLEEGRAPVDNLGAAAVDEFSVSEAPGMGDALGPDERAVLARYVSELEGAGVKNPAINDPALLNWLAQGYSPGQLKQAIGKALSRRRLAGSAAPVNVGFVSSILQQDFRGVGAFSAPVIRARKQKAERVGDASLERFYSQLAEERGLVRGDQESDAAWRERVVSCWGGGRG